jgi:LacI family transcriptional regulator
LGVLLPDLYGEFYSELIRGLDQQARQRGYHLLVSGMHAEVREIRALVRAMRGRVDGLILMGPHLESEILAGYLPAGVPVVLIGNRTDFPCDTVRVDNVGGARKAVEHLIRLGHQRIALLSGPLTNQEARERREGYRQALQEAGLALLPTLELEGDFTEASGYALGKKLLARRPTAVFVSNDAMAIGLLRWLHEVGVRVPDQLALVAFDDIPMARYTRPALTTVHSPIYELGVQAVDQLLEALKEGTQHLPQEVVLPVHLVVRESCGAGVDRLPPIP